MVWRSCSCWSAPPLFSASYLLGDNRYFWAALPFGAGLFYVGRLVEVEDADHAGCVLESYSYHAFAVSQQQQKITRNWTGSQCETERTETSQWSAGLLVSTETKVGSDVTDLVEHEFDSIGRLVGSTRTETPVGGAQEVTSSVHAYDALDRRVSTSTVEGSDPATMLRYVFDGLAEEASVEQDGDPAQPHLRWLVDDPMGAALAEVRDDKASWALSDFRGSTVATLDAEGGLTATFDYDSWGDAKESGQGTASGQAPARRETAYTYTGQRYDPVAGATDHGARSYSPSLRSWLSTDQYLDPLADLGLAVDPLNGQRTMYVAGNPINRVDEDGHLFLALFAPVVKAVVSVVKQIAPSVSQWVAQAVKKAVDVFVAGIGLVSPALAATINRWRAKKAAKKAAAIKKMKACVARGLDRYCKKKRDQPTKPRAQSSKPVGGKGGSSVRPELVAQPVPDIILGGATGGGSSAVLLDGAQRLAKAPVDPPGTWAGVGNRIGGLAHGAKVGAVGITVSGLETYHAANSGGDWRRPAITGGSSLLAGAAASYVACGPTAGIGCITGTGILVGMGVSAVAGYVYDKVT